MVFISNIIWIDENIANEENKKYIKELQTIGSLRVRCFAKVEKAISHMKFIEFQDTKVIISDKLVYDEFINKFEENLLDMYVIPKIILFLKNKDKFNDIMNFQNINNSFYNYGGIKTSFQEIKNYLLNKNSPKSTKKPSDVQLTFEYIDCEEKLALPLFYKTLIDTVSNDNMDIYTKSLFDSYGKENEEINELLGSINSIPNIPIELLSKYYARMFTIESNFYRDMNRDLQLNKKEKYLSFIKTLYNGVKLKALPLASNKLLYRGSKISKMEIEIIQNYLKNKIKDLPGAIVFSKSFLSFSKEKSIAESFLNNYNKNYNYFKVLYILEKDDYLDYNLSTHGDIEKISFFPSEREVLFLPFSSFEIKDIKEIKIGEEKRYEIKLLYLGKYLKEIKKNKKIINENEIPNSEFKKQLCEFGLIKKEKVDNLNTKKLYNEFKKYENYINNDIHKKKKKNYINNENDINNNIPNPNLTNLILKSDKNDRIMDLISKLYNKGLISDYIEIKDEFKYFDSEKGGNTKIGVVVKKFICSKKILPKNWDIISKKWIPAWHGTKFEYLESIVENGLKLPGSKLKDGKYTPNPKDIPLKDEVSGIKHWENAIFASQNIQFAIHYSDEINYNNWYDYTGLVEVKIRPNSFTKHKSKFIVTCFGGHFSIDNWSNNEIDDIFRISSEEDIIVTSITFIDNQYILSRGSNLLVDFY